MFYKLYNQNAMWFVSYIKVYKINSKFVKTVNQNVYSIGFPVSVIAQIEQQLTNVTAVLLPLLAADATLIAGLMYYNTTTNKIRGCNGTAWVDLN